MASSPHKNTVKEYATRAALAAVSSTREVMNPEFKESRKFLLKAVLLSNGCKFW